MAKKYLTTTSFSELAEAEMPREKALRHGLATLTDAELMAIIFGTGIKGVSVLEMARQILDAHEHHLSQIAALSAQDFMKAHKGIGPAKALTLLCGIELGIRAARDAASMPEPQILSSQAAYQYMKDQLATLDHEEFWALFLSNSAKVISKQFIASGGQASTIVDNKILMRRALESKCARMIIFHNHPSGTLKPSMQDDNLTRKIKQAAEIFDIRVDDHIIITPKFYYSYNDEGRL